MVTGIQRIKELVDFADSLLKEQQIDVPEEQRDGFIVKMLQDLVSSDMVLMGKNGDGKPCVFPVALMVPQPPINPQYPDGYYRFCPLIPVQKDNGVIDACNVFRKIVPLHLTKHRFQEQQ